MGHLKPLILPLCLSVGLHAAMGWSLVRHWREGVPGENAIQISYPEAPKAAPAPPVLKAEPAVPAPAKKKFKGIPIPRGPVEPEPAKAEEPSDFQRKLDEKLQKQRRALARLQAETPSDKPSTETAPRAPRSGAEILADPQKGKVFIGYFSDIKTKIQNTLVARFSNRYSGKGSVAVGFVLNSEGFIEKVAVLPRAAAGDPRLEDLAVQCLRQAAPFGPFPPELGSDRIAFNVTIFFDGR